MDLSSYINPELFIIVPVLYALGAIIKKSSIPDRFIPVILGVVGVSLALVYCFATQTADCMHDILLIVFAGVTQGILCAATSVYANNIVKQLKKREEDEDYKGN